MPDLIRHPPALLPALEEGGPGSSPGRRVDHPQLKQSCSSLRAPGSSIFAGFVEPFGGIIAAAVHPAGGASNRPPAALIAAGKEEEMTAEKFRTLSSWVAAAFISVLMLTAAATSHPILI
jgi:DNA-binding IclR family transcriptional regulator